MRRVKLGNILGPQGIQGPTGGIGPRGPQGKQGNDGRNGMGVPTGGTPNQVLVKTSNSEYATEWRDASWLIIDDGMPMYNKSYSSQKVNESVTNLSRDLRNEINNKVNNSGYEILYEVTMSGIYGISGKEFKLKFTNGFRNTDTIIFLPMYSTEENQNNLLAIGGWTAVSNGYNPSQQNEWKFVANGDIAPEMAGKYISVTALIFRKKGV